MFEPLLIAIALTGGFAAGLYDLKTTNVPDKLCIFMIAIGLILNFLTGVFTKDFSYFIDSLLFGGLFLGFGLLMYYMGQWGGGDGELLIAMGVLLPNVSLVKTYFPFAISFFINSFFIGAIWSIAFSFYFVYKNPGLSKKFFEIFKNPVTFSIALTPLILSVIFLNFNFLFSLLFLLVFILFVFYKFSKIIELAFYRKIPVSQLKVDDMLGEDIPRLRLYKKHIKGLTKGQVEKIKKIKRYVVIREGIRYGIVFPLTLLFTLLFGDLFLFLI